MEVKINERLKWVEHNGIDILMANYQNLKGAAFVDLIRLSKDYIVSVGKCRNDGLLILSDVTGAVIGTEAVAYFKESLAETAPYIRARAQVGTEGMKKHILNFLNSSSPFDAQAFDNEEDAKDWLAQRITYDS
jgi:hypothetical protein